MSRGWTVVHYEEGFFKPLAKRISHIMKRLKNPPRERKTLLSQWDEIKEFSSKIVLSPAKPGTLPLA